MDIPDDYNQIKCDVFRIIKNSQSCRTSKGIIKRLKSELPDVDYRLIQQAINELFNDCNSLEP